VVALGAPLGLSSTVTAGIVSALDRTVQVAGDNGKNALLISAVQTDAAINPGNSGGALTDCSGDLIGVPSAIATVSSESSTSAGSVGLAFAIPVDLAKAVSDQLISSGTITHAYVGIEVIMIPPAAAKQSGTPGGIYVNTVVPGGPAANAGLLAGDIITRLDGEPATDPNKLAVAALKKKPGDTVAVTYVRSGQEAQTTVTLGAQP